MRYLTIFHRDSYQQELKNEEKSKPALIVRTINRSPGNRVQSCKRKSAKFTDSMTPQATLNSISERVADLGGAFDSAKNHKRQCRKRQSITAKREKSQTPNFV